jgi:molybdopterin-guanine dinucleotide biosynthesis protein A
MRGLLTGLRAATHETCFVVACDMPRARIASGRKILRRAAGRDCAIAIGPGGLKEPLFGIYRKSCLPAIEGLLAAGERSLLALYERVRTAYIPLDPGEMPVNLNTPEDFRLFVENL